MSILGQTAAIVSNSYVIIGVLVALGVPLFLALALRVHRPRAVIGPERLAPRQSAVQLVAALSMGLGSYFIVPILYMSVAGIHQKPISARFMPTPANTAFLNTVPALAFFVTLWLADWSIGGMELLRGLGVALRRLPWGITMGILAALIILPPTYIVSGIADHIYHQMHLQLPTEHELLRTMREPESRFVQVVLILAATVVAPVVEEFVFRGHLQTILRSAIGALSSRWRGAATAPGFPMDPGRVAPVAPNVQPENEGRDTNSRPPSWQVWLSIIITSCLFTSVHEAWTWPAIFLLSLGLGYCYERTGNLWASMTIHCLFNSTSTFVFLAYR